MITQRNHYLISRRSKFIIAVPKYSAETLFLSFDILMSEQKGRAEGMDPLVLPGWRCVGGIHDFTFFPKIVSWRFTFTVDLVTFDLQIRKLENNFLSSWLI